MVVELISVGTELLLGNIVNTNAAYLAEQCANCGLSCFYQTVVGDNEERLQETVKAGLKRSDILILTGGLGPTDDDLTKEVVTKAMKKKLVEDEKAREMIQTYFDNRGMEITENNWKQAMVPEGAIVMYNNNGTAPGLIVESGEKCAILLPGPPNEMKPMFEEYVKDYLKKKNPEVIVSTTVKLCGIGESKVADMIQDMLDNQSNPTIAPYAKTGEVHLRVTAKAADEKSANKLIKPVVKQLKTRLAEYIYTTDENTTLENAIVDLLVANKLTVSTVESCTGGMIAARLINVPGVSDVFKMGHITYSNKAKKKILGVKKRTLEKHTAVSAEVAQEMVKGVEMVSKADVCVSVTGLAGPDGGTAKKPVGLVYIACSVKGNVTVQEYHFNGNRAKIRENATASALTLMRKCILEYMTETAFMK
ncbi:MAG: competence/damage-inducible protein A [Lachnospiraceae bacterium]|nr:competence/damage-inducible protein A [Lachnospiraceae bacterium]MBQ3036055.1 competence/damage-inducible protein A [Lachnospiraceae bacterium]